MIESCSAKRMLACIIFLGSLTIIILVFESNWTKSNIRNPTINDLNLSNSECWLREENEILEECHPCSEFELASQSNEACKHSGYKEAVQCKISGRVYRSCAKVSWIEERKFWKFESVIFVFSLLSVYTASIRQRTLDRRVAIRIQKQLANYL